MKNFLKKLTDSLKLIFGYGITIVLFGGGITFFGYLTALIIGGNTAIKICAIIYENIMPIIIYASSILVLLGLLIMYMSKESAFTVNNKK